jgi:hypothetical protein
MIYSLTMLIEETVFSNVGLSFKYIVRGRLGYVVEVDYLVKGYS